MHFAGLFRPRLLYMQKLELRVKRELRSPEKSQGLVTRRLKRCLMAKSVAVYRKYLSQTSYFPKTGRIYVLDFGSLFFSNDTSIIHFTLQTQIFQITELLLTSFLLFSYKEIWSKIFGSRFFFPYVSSPRIFNYFNLLSQDTWETETCPPRMSTTKSLTPVNPM